MELPPVGIAALRDSVIRDESDDCVEVIAHLAGFRHVHMKLKIRYGGLSKGDAVWATSTRKQFHTRVSALMGD